MLLLDPPAQDDLLLIIHLLLAGIGMYAFCRAVGLPLWASVFAATIWEANGYNAFWLLLEHVAFAAAWLPWSLFTATLAVRRNSVRWAVLCGLTVAMAVLTGSIQVVYVSGLVLAAWYGTLVVDLAWSLRHEEWHLAPLVVLMPLI